MLTEDYGVHVAYSHYLPILTGLALRKPIAVCAQSIGPFKWTRALSRRILNRVQLVTARDPITYEYLRSMGVDNPSLRLTADMAFLLERAPKSRVDEILRAEGIDLKAGPVLGVSVSGLIRAKYESSNPAAKVTPFEQFFAQLIDSVAAKLGCQVLFVAHVTGPSSSKDDRLVAKAVQARMSRPAWVLTGDYDPRELKAIISGTQLFFGARMHANIAALSSGVPTVAISYSHKTQGIMDLLQQRERVVSIGSLTREQCEAQLVSAWEAREEIRRSLEARMPEVATLARENIALLRGLLAAPSSSS
jgi:colanic acid/amylovoran biosynthesis protein